MLINNSLVFALFFLQLTEQLKKHIFHLAWSPENLPTVDAIYPLLEFLDRRLEEVNRCLLYGNYIRCLHVIWDTVVLQLKAYADVSMVGTKNIFCLYFLLW